MRFRAVRRKALTALLATLALGVVPGIAAGPAAAGGPTSVLLSSPSLGRTASLYTTDTAYTELAEQVGAFTSGGKGERGPSTDPTGESVTATWLIHDVQVWRVDRIYLDAAGGPWIATQQVLGGTGSIWDSPVRWSRAADGTVLADLMWSLGLVQGAPEAPGAEPLGDTAPDAASPAGDTARSAAPADDRGATDRGLLVLVALGGVAAGAALAVGASALRRRSAATAADLDDLGIAVTAEADGFATEMLDSTAADRRARQPAGIRGGR